MYTFISSHLVNNTTVNIEIDNHKKNYILHCDCIDQTQNLEDVWGNMEEWQLNGSDWSVSEGNGVLVLLTLMDLSFDFSVFFTLF